MNLFFPLILLSIILIILLIKPISTKGPPIPPGPYPWPVVGNIFQLGKMPHKSATIQWKNLRSIGRSELFSAKAMESQSSIRSEKITEMVRKLIREFVVLALSATPNLTDVFPVLGDWDVMGTSKKCKGIFDKMYAIWEGIIEERRKQSSRQHDLLDTLVKLGLTNDQINPFIMELFSAGTEPTTLTVQWALAELIKNEGPRHKLLDELEKKVGQDIVRETNLPHLPYLEACIKEALRLHPPAPLLLPHRTTQTCQVMGYTIPKDAIVNVNLWAMARDPKIWADPLRFNPERFPRVRGAGLHGEQL
ncbi:hypothetical protein Acr_24g0014820 [Actinidia rufa]|uniref:Uncharacterized protein n=1 Tax=Actinidia rufa TaxID=165716 RepID=A0A7J0GWX9_9ERIC|nr:hypothetical protein Acr_24g0014820 [Actinidia rufa]